MAKSETRNEVEVRSQKVDQLRAQGIDPYPSQARERSHTTKQVIDLFSPPAKELEPGETDPDEKLLKVLLRIK